MSYVDIANANRRYYAVTAPLYDKTETCAVGMYDQRMLDQDLEKISALLLSSMPTKRLFHTLDACGGSGNVAIKLLKRGFEVTVCDISPELLRLLQQKTEKLNYSPQVVCDEILNFLSNEKVYYDIIAFSSALHHIFDYRAVLLQASNRLNPGGILYTVFDPVSRSSLKLFTRLILLFDYLTFKILDQTTDLPKSVFRRIKRAYQRFWNLERKDESYLEDESWLGVLAEYHANTGIDDILLVNWLNQQGFEILWHERYRSARYRLFRSLLREPTSFKLVLRKEFSPS